MRFLRSILLCLSIGVSFVLFASGISSCSSQVSPNTDGGPVERNSEIAQEHLIPDASNIEEVGIEERETGGESISEQADTSPTATGCDDTKLLALPEDPAQTGPWPVGVRTIKLAELTTEILYPAQLGSQQGKERVRYDLRDHLPDEDRSKISDKDNPWQEGDAYRDLPVDTAHGRYPVIVFIHGTASFRTQSLQHLIHWASRGFVVLAADHPGIMLKDALQLKLAPKQAEEARAILAELRKPAPELAFIASVLDITRIAIIGHSAGGMALSTMGDEPGVKVLIPMASAGVSDEHPPQSTLILGGMDDETVVYERQQKGFVSSPKPKRLVGLANAGHLAFSDLCAIGRDKGGILKIAIDSGVNVPSIFKGMIEKLATDGCKQGQLAPEIAWKIIHYATSAVLEETLHCSSKSAPLIKDIQKIYKEVGEFQEEL
jgi:predicted dienelactone hydrolase